MLVFAVTIFLSAFLLFQLELIIAKELLPWFGGTPSVWTTCLLFFQFVLLAGYSYAHLLYNRLKNRPQVALHLLLVLFSLVVLALHWLQWPSPLTPDDTWKPIGENEPIGRLISLLAVSVGVPFLILSTTGPLLQGWYVSVHPSRSPYRLYALSNIGSLIGLLAYPLIVEPLLPIRAQSMAWSVLYVMFTIGVSLCAIEMRKSQKTPSQHAEAVTPDHGKTKPNTIEVILWTAFAGSSSALLLSTTNQMCQDTATIPLLWVLPLALYLLSFILCFEFEWLYKRWFFPPLFGVSLLVAISSWAVQGYASLLAQVGVDAAVLFTGCMVCHGELALLKPRAIHLTLFYLSIAVGGALGGLGVAIVAPYLFNGFWEFQLSLFIVGTLFLLSFLRDRTSFFSKRWFLVGSVISIVLVISAWLMLKESLEQTDDLKSVKRNFYGILRVSENSDNHYLRLFHGRITHGIQYLEKEMSHIPTTYYSKESGIGLAIQYHPRRNEGLRIGVVGLGVGTIAAYGENKDTIRFYEINPAVYQLSQGPNPYFTYLKDCKGHVDVAVGDARLLLEGELRSGRIQNFDVLAIDAFSSDAIPVHLLTQEAFEIYRRHLRLPDGIIAIHISNRHLDLKPVVHGIASQAGLSSIRILVDANDEGGWSSDWILLSPSKEVLELGPFTTAATPWDSAAIRPIRLWTDDYSNLISVLK